MTDSKTAERKKLSVIPRGHWRCIIGAELDAEAYDDTAMQIEPGVWLTTARWPSREVADERGSEAEHWYRTHEPEIGVKYLRAEFFPDP